MRILHFVAENYKRLQVVDITPDGAVVDIQGKNGHGKSSVLDAVYAVLAGKDAVQPMPIRRGAARSKIVAEIGGDAVELVVTRTFAAAKDGGYTTTLTVESPDGAQYRSPQALLDGLLGALSFDPLEFLRMDSKAQLGELRKLVPSVDWTASDAANKADFDRRTEVNRDLKQWRAQLAGIVVASDAPAERIDVSALVKRLEDAGLQNAQTAARRVRRERAEADVVAKRREINGLALSIEQLVARKNALTAEVAGLESRLAGADVLPEEIDTTAIRAEIDAARELNRAADERERLLADRDRLTRKIAADERLADELSAAIKRRNEDRAAAVAAAKLPIEGLELGDGEVLFGGLPLVQASDAEALRVSVALAAALNPKLRVIRVKQGSLLDDDGLALLSTFAAERDLQVWIERVTNDAKTGIVLEDGRLKAAEVAA